MSEDVLLTTDDVARLLNVRIQRVYEWIKSGRLAAINVGTEKKRDYRIERRAYEEFRANSRFLS